MTVSFVPASGTRTTYPSLRFFPDECGKMVISVRVYGSDFAFPQFLEKVAKEKAFNGSDSPVDGVQAYKDSPG